MRRSLLWPNICRRNQSTWRFKALQVGHLALQRPYDVDDLLRAQARRFLERRWGG